MSAEYRWPEHLEADAENISDALLDALLDLTELTERYFKQNSMPDDAYAMKHFRLGFECEAMRRAYARKAAKYRTPMIREYLNAQGLLTDENLWVG